MDELTKYIDFDILEEDFINLRIMDYGGLEAAIIHQFSEVDCKRILSNGMRGMQTNIYRYIYEMSMTMALINQIEDEERRKEFTNHLIKIHNDNIQFEKENPPIDYKYKHKKAKTNKPAKSKQERFPFDKEVKAVQKLKDKFKSFGTIKLNIK